MLVTKKEICNTNTICPICGSTNIVGDSVEIHDSFASQHCFCNSCAASWIGIYNFDHIIVLEQGIVEKELSND